MSEMITEPEILTIPALPMRGTTVFPHMSVHFEVERELSMRALNAALDRGKRIFLVTQKDITQDQVGREDLYTIGTISEIHQVLRLPGDRAMVLAEGSCRGIIRNMTQETPYLLAEVEAAEEDVNYPDDSAHTEALLRRTFDLIQEYAGLTEKVLTQTDVLLALSTSDPGLLADFVAENIPLRFEDKQSLLEELVKDRRLEQINVLLEREIEVARIDGEIQNKMHQQVEQSQREYYLREQLKAIQSELGEDSPHSMYGGPMDDEIQEYAEKIQKTDLPQEVRDKLKKELDRLSKQPSGSSDAAVLRNYLDVCLELPWNKKTKERLNLEQARKILDRDHYGLEQVKKRILEFLAVKQLAPDLKGQILCLVGPPGVGKTSIAASVAKALNRKMARLSLGGIRDEAEIRGHRKTYVGAMPGRIIDAVNRAGTSNPLLLLDEIDKLGSDYRGDPSAALLEVLDAEQNATFRDHFLEMSYDLSDVLFITTCNTLNTVPQPLLDRMEIIEVSSYTDEEKLQIARRHLLPREMKRHGLNGNQLRVTDDAIRELIVGYTRESGVRQMERELAALCRKAAAGVVEGDGKRILVNGDNLEQMLGVRKYHPERLERVPRVGVVNGLAWTSVGGEILEVEAAVMEGSGTVQPTGNLGDVMKESCQAAISFIRSNARTLGVNPTFYKNTDIHIHFPEGATPKDGPSAGVSITTAILSALTGNPVRADLAMTGEVTIRGRVLPIGGLREKTMAAYRNGIHTIILPEDNLPDLEDIDQTVRAGLHFVPVRRAEDVVREALVNPIRPYEAKPEEKEKAGETAQEDVAPVELLNAVHASVSQKRPQISQ